MHESKIATLEEVLSQLEYAMDREWNQYTDRFIIEEKLVGEERWRRCGSSLYKAYQQINGLIVELEDEIVASGLAALEKPSPHPDQADNERDVSARWAESPDRSGGQYTDDEINNAGRWI